MPLECSELAGIRLLLSGLNFVFPALCAVNLGGQQKAALSGKGLPVVKTGRFQGAPACCFGTLTFLALSLLPKGKVAPLRLRKAVEKFRPLGKEQSVHALPEH